MPTLLRVVIHEHAGAHVTYKTKRKGTRKTQRPFVACRETDKVRVWGAICSKLSEMNLAVRFGLLLCCLQFQETKYMIIGLGR